MPVNWWDSVGRQIDAGETDKRIYCADCGVLAASQGDWYMLKDKVWARTGLAPDAGVLCLPCCERRLRRDLRMTDFAIADEGDCLAGFWPGHRMLPRRWNEYVANRGEKHKLRCCATDAKSEIAAVANNPESLLPPTGGGRALGK